MSQPVTEPYKAEFPKLIRLDNNEEYNKQFKERGMDWKKIMKIYWAKHIKLHVDKFSHWSARVELNMMKKILTEPDDKRA